MQSGDSANTIPLGIQQRIDACCRAFEQGWKDGRNPKLEEFLSTADDGWRNNLLSELVAIEFAYRQNETGGPLTDSQICDLHPALKPKLLVELHALRRSPSKGKSGKEAGPRLSATPRNLDVTEDHASPQSGSRGLHIRCPHCSNPVELLSDTPDDSITCRTCGSEFSLVDEEGHTAEALTLKKLGRFELVARLGVGGFGTVWKARDTELDRAVAIKIPRKGQLDRAEVEQFVREARMTAQLRHPNIVPVHEVGREGETIFIVSDLIRGVSLSDWLTGESPSFRVIAELAVTIAEGLHHAHQQGVIHRDLKPSNILIDERGQPHVMDFGLAKREMGEITMTVDGQILGTPAYMSPEQAGGDSRWTDRRSDIYSLGVVLFRMLTGELPFRGNSQMQIHQRLTKDPPDPRTLNRFIPHDLSTICLKCLEPDPNRRCSTAQELADELTRFLRGEPILSRPISSIERGLRWSKRKPALATAAALILFLAVAGPLAAVTIYYAKHRQAELLVEKNNLIDKLAAETQTDTTKLDELTKKLDVWEGRANPWEFWPPMRDAPPRLKLSADFYGQSKASLEKQLQSPKIGTEDAARGYLALAMMAEATGEVADAIKYYQKARDQLVKLQAKNPDVPRFSLALAECYGDLARLTIKTDRAAAADYLTKEQTASHQLAVSHKVDARFQIDWLEAELKSAMLIGAESAHDHLTRVDEINRSLTANWPTDPAAAYRLACYLCVREPMLAPLESKQPAAVEGE